MKNHKIANKDIKNAKSEKLKIIWFLSFSSKNDAESLCHFVKIPFLDPKRAKFVQIVLRKVYGKFT